MKRSKRHGGGHVQCPACKSTSFVTLAALEAASDSIVCDCGRVLDLDIVRVVTNYYDAADQTGTTVKALSLHQPWACYVANGTKTIETRMWSTKHRGALLICSTIKPDIPPLLSGHALCLVMLRDVRDMRVDDERMALCASEPGRKAWVIDSLWRFSRPFKVRGKQSLFDVKLPEDVAAEAIQRGFAPLYKS